MEQVTTGMTPEKLREQFTKQEKNTENQNPTTSDCNKCDGTGYIARVRYTDGKRTSDAIECECLIPRRINSRLPVIFRDAKISDFSRQLQRDVSDWILNPKFGLLITGKTGRGKSYLAAAIVRLAIQMHFDAIFLECDDLYLELRESYHSELSEDSVLLKYLKVKFLILDDLGAGSLSDYERRMTLRLINKRCTALMPTVVTTNWSALEIGAKMDERISSRLALCTAIELTGKDKRIHA